MSENTKVVKKRKRKRLKIGYILAVLIIIFVIVLGIKLVLPSGSSKYGNRLEGIKKIKFGKTEQEKIVKKVKESDKVTTASIDVEGKIINVIFNVNKDTSKDDARNIANSTLEVISDEVKNFYDIQYMISKKDEEGTTQTITKEDGTTEDIKVKEFPIMGYKNSKSKGIVW